MSADPPASAAPDKPGHEGPKLRRALSLPLLVLYGLGVTIGAGIYVLIGATAGRAGIYAPFSFLIAALVMGFSAASFAELTGRYPVSAGEAAYVRGAFGSNALSLLAGSLVIFTGVVSSAAIAVGSAGYLLEFVTISELVVISCVVLFMGLISIWGIVQSVTFAGIFTLIEVGGLLAIIFGGFGGQPEILERLPEALPPLGDAVAMSAVMSAGLLAFFAFVGFEDLVNLAEEAREPARMLPWAILLTLLGASLVYLLVTYVAVWTVPAEELAASRAPLSLVFERTTGLTSSVITLVAVVATLNGVIVQMVMSARVLYGLARQGSLPAVFARVNKVTHTPIQSTVAVVATILVLALFIPLEPLAEATSFSVLTSFALVNLALVKLKLARKPAPANACIVGTWVPVVGFLTCLAFLAGSIAARFDAF